MGTVLVTGGCGYIGSHTSISLVKRGYNVVIYDSLINSYKESYEKILIILKNTNKILVNKISFFEGDLRNKKLLEKLFSDKQKEGNPIFSVIHFAGLKSMEESIRSPLKYWESNVGSTISLLEVMEKYSCHSIIFSSSASIYKPKNIGLLKEEDSLDPLSPYGKTKLTIESILKDLHFHNLEKWRVANLRNFNPVGVHEPMSPSYWVRNLR